jgi:hypothetical protein
MPAAAESFRAVGLCGIGINPNPSPIEFRVVRTAGQSQKKGHPPQSTARDEQRHIFSRSVAQDLIAQHLHHVYRDQR